MAPSRYHLRYLLASIPLCCALSASSLTPDEAWEFLQTTLSLPDRADYSEEFYRENIASSLKAREELPWGKSVPDREFLHFVLPVRVNNENLDSSRMVFYDILKERVKDLSMKDAILEVNHWCHENVTYRPSDARTSSPLSSVSQAIGRCGEESTYTVAALRAVGIPARQIYTPRWAHTDDNHAWVEAWADGEWHFLGACEPEPVLDLAWFNTPASRGLLMNTNVAGRYDGPEEILLAEPLTTRINVTGNYAPTATLPVTVVYPDGTPAKGAKVHFCIYNYSEYYPAVTKVADAAGSASLTTGLGDVVVWATDGRRFGFAKGSAADYASGVKEGLTIVLDKDQDYEGSFEMNITPPPAGASLPVVAPEQRAGNDRRLAYEDSIRNAYTSTFATAEDAARLAAELEVDPKSLTTILTESRGNHRMLSGCLSALSPAERRKAMDLLMSVSEKDRRDIPEEVIIDHITFTEAPEKSLHGSDKEIYNRYILNPRIELEGLRPWRSLFASAFSTEDKQRFRNDPEEIVKWISTNITVDDTLNPQRLRMSPGAVMSRKRADSLSRNILFVAIARGAGIPARIDPVTGATQYMGSTATDWNTVDFGVTEVSDYAGKPGSLKITFTPEGYLIDPKYYSQFSLSRIIDGTPRQLEYDEEGTVSSLFPTPVTIEPGQYILTTGQRLADGGVLTHSEIFTVTPGEEVNKELTIRQEPTALSVIGSLNAENIYHDTATGSDKSILSTTGRGYYVLALVNPSHEPSSHLLNDISAVAPSLEALGNKMIILFDDDEKAARFDRSLFRGLPSTMHFGVDNGNVSRKEILGSLHMPDNTDYPVIVIADTFNRIVWVATGYSIGTGELLLRHLSTLR
ncbi:MAG: transglutaminase domain-containing protein [Bacteroides sp.]|nr:transglutaminase domain-containing protein [Bacteroides sp.]